MKIKILIVIILFILNPAASGLSFSCSMQNSEDSISQSMSGENLVFDASAVLDSESISMQGSGSAIGPQSSYSYGLYFNGDPMVSAADTDSGNFSWSGKGIASWDISDASVSSKAVVVDGNLTLFYKNFEVEISEDVQTMESMFQEMAMISTDSVFSQGIGTTNAISGDSGDSTISQEDEIRGVDQILVVEGFGKSSKINSDLYGNAQVQWMSSVAAGESSYSLGMAAAGICEDESDLTRMEIIGQATGFPDQKLPPGHLDVESLFEGDSNSAIDKEFMANEIEKFNEENSIDQCLKYLYNLEQTTDFSLNGYTPIYEWSSHPGLFFKMKMDFKVDKG
ncbi:MAG: hypothetical protein PHW87_08770 [Methanothrix sp.]|nr:hypothetical protein [Methanothrix sp.]